MSATVKRFIVLIFDSVVTLSSYYLSKLLIRGSWLKNYTLEQEVFTDLSVILIIFLFFYLIFRICYFSWRFASVYEATIIFLNNLLVFFVLLFLCYLGYLSVMTPTSLIFGFAISTLISECARFVYRSIKMIDYRAHENENKKTVIIYGAGKAGQLLIRECSQNSDYKYKIVGLIDDDTNKKGNIVSGYKVLGTGKELPKYVQKYNVNKVIIAMPSSPKESISNAIKTSLDSGVENIKLVSSSLVTDPTSVNKSLRKVSIKDLLNRKEISFENDEIQSVIKGKVIMVTGAGGSIGSELVRQIVNHNPKKIIILDINETGLYQIEQELNISQRLGELSRDIVIEALVGSIRDKQRMETIFKTYNPQIIYHAAAHKHVPLMEKAPKEAIKNNIFGTKNIIDLSIKYNVEKFINISTDKAVNPTNVMGATKRFIEMMIQSSETIRSNTVFCAVRFGNVLGSNGSVIPLFKEQIEKGGPVTVTHPEMVRYFMTIPEAVSLVLQAGTYANGGEIFVLDMGDPVKISELAHNMIKLSGYEPNVDIDIKYVGLRPGEKLYEELLMQEEGLGKTANDLIFVAKPQITDSILIETYLKTLKISLESDDRNEVKKSLANVVSTYTMESN